MKNIFAKSRGFIFWLTCFVLCNPLIVKAANEGAEQQNELNPVEGVIAIIVFVVVTYKVYHAMHDGTAIIGTREGIQKAKREMLTIPLICGLIAAAIVIFLLRILFKIIIVLLIIAAVIGVIVFICKMVGKKGNASNETVGGQSDTKAITDASMAVSETENIIQGSEEVEAVSKGDKAETNENVDDIKDANHSIRNIISKIDVQDTDLGIGTPIAKGELLEKARKQFEIPASENVYLIYDNTILGSCKTGFAICESGIYSRLKQQRYMPWAEFKTTRITSDIFLGLGGDEFNVGNDKKKAILFDVLVRIQESIE